MKPPAIYNEWQRRRRIKNPDKLDYCAYMLTGIMGAEWWIANGFEREVKVGRCSIDFGNRALKIGIEGDGERYHMDVLKDEARDKFLRSRGWYIVRFRYPRLKNRPAEVRKELHELMASQIPTASDELKIREQMRRSGL